MPNKIDLIKWQEKIKHDKSELSRMRKLIDIMVVKQQEDEKCINQQK